MKRFFFTYAKGVIIEQMIKMITFINKDNFIVIINLIQYTILKLTQFYQGFNR